jgi:hypothetical protein
MSAQNIRIMKEARALFWPWVAVMLVAVSRALLSTLRFNYGTPMLLADGGIAGFYLGPPLLAALSFGNEFQYRTVSVLLAQPVARLQIWREKLAVMLVAVLAVSLAYFLTWRADFEQDIVQWVFSAAFLVAVVGSSTFWTLIARSTVGGVLLNIAVQGTITAAWAAPAQTAFARHLPADAYPFLVFGFVGTLCYSGFMLWIGRRKLALFQVTGEVAGQDLLSGRQLMPQFFARWLRWKPAGATLNVVKKEMRLLRPVWLLALLTISFLVCLALLSAFSYPFIETFVSGASAAGVLMYLLLGGILAGSLSMGEERQSGTHSWHLVLPISVREQWFIKLVSSLLVSFVCGFLVLRSADLLLGPLFQKVFHEVVNGRELPFVAFYLLSLTFPAFCCSCAVNGTVRAAAWTVPALMFLSLAGGLAALVQGFFVAGLHVMQPVMLAVHAFPGVAPDNFIWDYGQLLVVVVAPVFAVFQSFRLFRAERAESMQAAVRPLLHVCAVVFCCVLFGGLIRDAAWENLREQRVVTREVGKAVSKLELDPATVDSAHPRAVSLADLNRVYPFSNVTQIWLKNASISVSPPLKPRGGQPVLRIRRDGKLEAANAKLSANIHFSNGWECQAYDEIGNCRGPGEQHPPLWPFFQ